MSAVATLAALAAAIDRAPLGARPPMEAARGELTRAERQLADATTAAAHFAALYPGP